MTKEEIKIKAESCKLRIQLETPYDDMTEDHQEKMDIGYMHEKSQFTEEKQCYSEKDRKYNF